MANASINHAYIMNPCATRLGLLQVEHIGAGRAGALRTWGPHAILCSPTALLPRDYSQAAAFIINHHQQVRVTLANDQT